MKQTFATLIFLLTVTTAQADLKHLLNCREYYDGKSGNARVTYDTNVICSSTGKPCLVYTINGYVYWEPDGDVIRPITPPPSPIYDPSIAVAWELIPHGSNGSYVMTSFPDPFDDSGWWRGHLFKKPDHTKSEMIQISELICIQPQSRTVE